MTDATPAAEPTPHATGAHIPPPPTEKPVVEAAEPATKPAKAPKAKKAAAQAAPEPEAGHVEELGGFRWSDRTTDLGRVISVTKGEDGVGTITREETLPHGATAAKVAEAKARLLNVMTR